MGKNENLEKDKRVQIGKQILAHDDIVKTINIKDEVFKIKFPTPIEQNRIENEIALKIGGVSLDSYPQSSYSMVRLCTTLDYVIQDKPEWWTTAGECYDEDLLTQLWDKYLELKEEFRRSIREGRFKRNST